MSGLECGEAHTETSLQTGVNDAQKGRKRGSKEV